MKITRKEYFSKYAKKQSATGKMTIAEYRNHIGRPVIQRKNKYNNIKCEYNGIKFDSKKEARRYMELELLEKKGIIKDLITQPKFKLLEKIKWEGKTLRGRSYLADFQYKIGEDTYVEDVKSKATMTNVYKLKKHLFLQKYPDLIFKEVL